MRTAVVAHTSRRAAARAASHNAPLPLPPNPLHPAQPPTALRKAIGQQLIDKALERSGKAAGGGGRPRRRDEPADWREFGALIERNRVGVLLGLFVCAQVRLALRAWERALGLHAGLHACCTSCCSKHQKRHPPLRPSTLTPSMQASSLVLMKASLLSLATPAILTAIHQAAAVGGVVAAAAGGLIDEPIVLSAFSLRAASVQAAVAGVQLLTLMATLRHGRWGVAGWGGCSFGRRRRRRRWSGVECCVSGCCGEGCFLFVADSHARRSVPALLGCSPWLLCLAANPIWVLGAKQRF